MPEPDFFVGLLRTLHIVGAVIALGGAIFLRLVLLPSAAGLPKEAGATLREQVRRRYGRIFMFATANLIVTGILTYVFYQIPEHKGQPAYHAIMGAKIMLAMVLFFIGSALVGRAPAFEAIRKKPKLWLSLVVLIGIVVIILAVKASLMPSPVPL